MKRGWKILIIIGGILVVALLASVARHYQLRAATNAYIAELKAKGEPMDLAQVLPPRVPPEENSAETFRKAAALFKADQSVLSNHSYYCTRMVAPGKAMVCSKQPEAYDYDATNSWEEVRAAIDQNADSYGLLRTLIEKPNLDFGINYTNGISDLAYGNLCLPELKRAAMRLQAAALSDLHRGNGDAATKNLRAMLAIAKAMREQRLIISELVRIAITQITFNANWEALQSTNVTDEQLAALQKDWAGLDFFEGEEHALEMERASGLITLAKWRDSSSGLREQVIHDLPWMDAPKPTAWQRLRIESRIFRWQYWWSYPDETRALKGYEALLSVARASQTNFALLANQKELESKVKELAIPEDSFNYVFAPDPMKNDFHFLLSSSIPELEKAVSRMIIVEAAKQMAVTAIALKRYQLKHSQYPTDLTALTPEFLPGIPRDPIDGQALRYRRNADGTFQLYSIGDDGKDDGGDPTSAKSSKSFQWQNGRDWVWPQPATAEEIRKFYESQPK